MAKQLLLLFLLCALVFSTACPKKVRVSTPKIPQSVRNIVDEEKPHRKGTGRSNKDLGNSNFVEELDLLMDQYDCLTGTIAYVSPPASGRTIPVVVTAKTTKKTTSRTTANTAENSISTINANTNANIDVVTTSVSNTAPDTNASTSTSSSKVNSNSTTDAKQKAETKAQTDAVTTEETTVTTDSVETQVTTQCGGVVVDDPDEAAKRLRNVIINRMLRVIDYVYFQFENDLYVSRASASFLGDVIDFGANFAATITNGERAKTIINAAIIAFRGGRRSAGINYFQEQTADVLITNMQTSRNRSLAGMLELMKKDVNDYPLDAGLRDVIGYFYAGTLPRALQELKKDSSIAAREAEKRVSVLKGETPREPATLTERNLSVGAFETLNRLSRDPTGKALEKLQRIAARIAADTLITTEMKKDADLTTLLAALETDKDDGKKLVNGINDIRYEGDGKLPGKIMDRIDSIIVETGKE